MTDLEKWNLIVSFFMPLVVSLIVRKDWSDEAKATVAFVACAVAGTVSAYFNGGLSGTVLPTAILEVLLLSIGYYKLFWQKVGFQGRE